mgnify:FL=1
MQENLNLPYSSHHQDVRLIDLFLPEPHEQNGRAILLIHGGGWQGGTRAGWHGVARHFCGMGYVTACPDYRLSPRWHHPAHVEDVRLAMGWFRSRAVEYGFEPDHVAALGSSAGGHLAAMLATIPDDDPLGVTDELPLGHTRPDATICYCPVLDVAAWTETHYGGVEAFLGVPPHRAPELCKEASPPARITGEEPPFLFMHGDADQTVPLEQSRRMAELLREAGVRAELMVLPGVGHGYGYGVETPAQKQSLARAETFLDQSCGSPR